MAVCRPLARRARGRVAADMPDDVIAHRLADLRLVHPSREIALGKHR